MRVLHITRSFYPAIGGLEDAVQNLALRQRARGIDAEIVTLNRPAGGKFNKLPPTDDLLGIPIRRVGWIGSSRYPLAPAVLRHFSGADLLHVHAIDSSFDVLAYTSWLHRRPMVASTHGGFFHTRFLHLAKVAWFNTLTRFSVRAYSGIIATGENDGHLFARLRPRLLRVIENGVDLEKWRDRGAKVPCKHIISFGRFASHKRIGLLFQLLRAIRAVDPDWTLTIAGTPADVTADTLSSEAAVCDGAARVIVQPDVAKLGELIGQAGYFACASSYEGFGIAAVEALSAGLVPFLSDIPPFRRLTRTLGPAYLFDPAEPVPSANRVLALHDRLRIRWSDARADFMTVAQGYGWDPVVAAHGEFYASALAGERSAQGPAGA